MAYNIYQQLLAAAGVPLATADDIGYNRDSINTSKFGGNTVGKKLKDIEDALENVGQSSGGSQSGGISGIINLKDPTSVKEIQSSLKDGESKTYIVSDDSGNYPSPTVDTIYLDNMDDLMDLLYRGNDLALRHIINNGEAYYKYLGIWSSENIRSYIKLPKFHLQTAKVGDLVTIIRHDFDSDVFYSKYIDFNSISNNNTEFQLFKSLSGFASSSDGDFIKHLIKTGNIYSAYSNPREDSSVITYPLAIDGKVQFYTAQITPNTQKVYNGEFWTENMTGPGIYSYVTKGRPAGSEDGEFYTGYVSPNGTQTLVSMKNPSKAYTRAKIGDTWIKLTFGVGKNTGGTGEIFNDYAKNTANEYAHAEGVNTSAEGVNSHAEGDSTRATSWNAHAEGYATQAGWNAHAEGSQTQATGKNSHAEGDTTKATQYNAHAEGFGTVASGNGAHAEGNSEGGRLTEASGKGSHAEGYGTLASGNYSHAENDNTTASGKGSHAEGFETSAEGDYSHTEGCETVAGQKASHAEGVGTIIDVVGGHAEGTYNYNTDAIHVVGIGTEDAYLDAHVITPDGKHYIYGVGGYKGKGVYNNHLDLASIVGTKQQINISESSITQDILPNILYVFEGIQDLNVTLSGHKKGVVNEYLIQFTANDNFTNCTINSSDGTAIKWASNLDVTVGHTYQISIINNLAVYLEFE